MAAGASRHVAVLWRVQARHSLHHFCANRIDIRATPGGSAVGRAFQLSTRCDGSAGELRQSRSGRPATLGGVTSLMQDRCCRATPFSVLSSLLCLISLCAHPALAQKLITPGYLFNSDPTCRQIGDTFYLFTTQDPFTLQFQRPNTFYRGMYAYHAFSTQDFDHWLDHGSILTGRDVSWNAGSALLDGDAGIAANGRFYAYAPFRINPTSEANYGRYDIVA